MGVWFAHRDNGSSATGSETTQVPTSKSSKRVISAAKNGAPSAPAITNPVLPLPAQPGAGNVQSQRGSETAQFHNQLQAGIQPAGTNPAPTVPALLPPPHLKGSGKDLAARAALVEAEANRELERLVPLLNLTPHQQDRVFAKLVENSPYWQPGIAAAGSTGGTEQKDTRSGSRKRNHPN